MNVYEIIGHVGAFLSSITFIPQVLQVYRTKSAKDLSMQMLFIIFVSTIVWLIYGVGTNALPVIICNSIIMLLSGWLIWFKWKSERQ
jgi:MtN3 and saliva related transmembrane protein